MFSYYMHSRVVISIQKQGMLNYETKINELFEAAALQETFEKEKKIVNGCLLEVATNINNHIQWTPVLIEIVKSMPDSILLTGIDLKQDTVKKKVLSKKCGVEKVDVVVPVRTLQIGARENSGFGHGQSIRDFQNNLRSSVVFSPRLDNINISQGIDTFKGQDVVSYQINCAFKPGL
jgi:hypothetical protein